MSLSIVKAVTSFLFGRKPKIFDAEGNVVHQFPAEKWKAWSEKNADDPNYNWRNHTGTNPKNKASNLP